MPRHPDIGWQHGTMIGEKRHHVQCNYCHRIMIGGITRFKKHLASKKGEIKGCDAVPRDVRDMIRNQLAVLKPKKGIEKKRKRAVVESFIVPSSGDHAIDSNASGTSVTLRHDLLNIGDMVTQASEPGIQQLTGTAESFDTFSNPAVNDHGSAPHRATDVGWAHGTMVNGDRQKIMCRYCQKIILGGGISRLKQHLAGERGNIAPCEKVPDDVKTHIQQHLGFKVLEKLKRQKITEDLKNSLQKAREGNNGILRNTVSRRTNCYRRTKAVDDESSNKIRAQNTVVVTTVGSGYKAPSYHSLRGDLLSKCLNETGDFCKEVRKSWEVSGCTIMVDRWIDKFGHAMINFYAYSLKGILFLNTVDASQYENSSEGLSNLFDSTIQQVGPRNVVAFLTDATPSHMAAAKALKNKYQTFFSCICANHCIELMLSVIAKMDEVKDILAKLKKICQLTYNNVWILNSFRKKTGGKEVFQPAATEFVTKFSTLQSMVTLKDTLQQVFISTSWEQSVLSEQNLVSEVMGILLDLQFWLSCSRILKVIKPLLAVVHQLDGEERSSMGFFYDSVENARKEIICAFDNKESDYQPYLGVIDHVWEELHSPLHYAAYYLNPSIYYNSGLLITNVIQKGLLDCIETLETNILSQDNITRQKSFYEDAFGDFSRPVAVRGRETLFPDIDGVCNSASSHLVVSLRIRLPRPSALCY